MKDEKELNAVVRDQWFANHVVEFRRYTYEGAGGPIIRIDWRDPSSSFYSVNYLLHDGKLVVTGDIGEAIYQFAPHQTLYDVAGSHFDYFLSKVRASSETCMGHQGYVWSRDAFTRGFEQLMKDSDAWDIHEAAYAEDLMDAVSAYDDLLVWISRHEDLFADYELMGQIVEQGLCPSMRCRGHWMGLRMALNRLLGSNHSLGFVADQPLKEE